MMSTTGQTMRAAAVPVDTLVVMLTQRLGRTVVDKTGRTGLFDFTLTFSLEGLAQPGLPPCHRQDLALAAPDLPERHQWPPIQSLRCSRPFKTLD